MGCPGETLYDCAVLKAAQITTIITTISRHFTVVKMYQHVLGLERNTPNKWGMFISIF